MEMCYDGTLVMPSSYAVMSEEEMTYVEGGSWSSYTGWDAIAQLTVIAGCAYTTGAAMKKVGASILATASTAIGLIAAVSLVVGFSVLAGATAYQAMLAVCAASFMVSSWKKTGSFEKAGFRVNGISIFTFTLCTEVGSLY